MSVKALQEFTRITRYARYNTAEERRETWHEQVSRVMNMHRDHLEHLGPEIEPYIEKAEYALKKKLVLGSQRALQFGGRAILEKHARLYNCTVSYCDRPRFFQEVMWLLLCGCGAGFSVQKHHIEKIPAIAPRGGKEVTYVVPDSIEGWADAIGVLLSSYFVEDAVFPEYQGKIVKFDLSEIRPAGSLIKSSGSKAPGPEGLKNSLIEIEKLLNRVLADAGNTVTKLRPIDAYDIVMHTSDAVLSGGVRRSATICIFSHDDEEMMKAKTGNWFVENPQRGRSNNSAMIIRNEITKEEFSKLIESVKQFGEPGFVFADNKEALYNPCVEIGMYAYDEEGNSGWSFCNLCEINVKKAKTEKDFYEMCEYGAILGTIQASYSNFDYLGPVTESIVRREALLGVSMTGMMDNPEISFNPEIQRKGAQRILEVNEEFAPKLGINPAARTTCVKPAGSTSAILGTASGIHPHHYKRYFRRVQVNKLEEPVQFFKLFNPDAVEESVWSNNNTDEVVTFLCEVPAGAKTKVDINALKLLDYVKLTQQNWVAYGKSKDRSTQPWLSHNVSNTINVKDDEWDEVRDFIFDNRQWFAGISLLPMAGDKDFNQAPFTAVYTPVELAKMYGDGQPMASGVIVRALKAYDGDLWDACAAILGFGEDLDNIPKGLSVKEINAWKRSKNYDAKKEWLRQAQQFADRYFEGDVRKMTYCLKDVHNWKLWCDLKRVYEEVPWEEFKELVDNTKVSETVACGGGKCEANI
jgi:ribonucleoside-diphosphate reductase alpha chain